MGQSFDSVNELCLISQGLINYTVSEGVERDYCQAESVIAISGILIFKIKSIMLIFLIEPLLRQIPFSFLIYLFIHLFFRKSTEHWTWLMRMWNGSGQTQRKGFVFVLFTCFISPVHITADFITFHFECLKCTWDYIYLFNIFYYLIFFYYQLSFLGGILTVILHYLFIYLLLFLFNVST